MDITTKDWVIGVDHYDRFNKIKSYIKKIDGNEITFLMEKEEVSTWHPFKEKVSKFTYWMEINEIKVSIFSKKEIEKFYIEIEKQFKKDKDIIYKNKQLINKAKNKAEKEIIKKLKIKLI